MVSVLETVSGILFYVYWLKSSPRIKKIVMELQSAVPDLPIREGVYGWFPGPSYETPSEVQAGIKIGMAHICSR